MWSASIVRWGEDFILLPLSKKEPNLLRSFCHELQPDQIFYLMVLKRILEACATVSNFFFKFYVILKNLITPVILWREYDCGDNQWMVVLKKALLRDDHPFNIESSHKFQCHRCIASTTYHLAFFKGHDIQLNWLTGKHQRLTLYGRKWLHLINNLIENQSI